jgi:hypothetical protein
MDSATAAKKAKLLDQFDLIKDSRTFANRNSPLNLLKSMVDAWPQPLAKGVHGAGTNAASQAKRELKDLLKQYYSGEGSNARFTIVLVERGFGIDIGPAPQPTAENLPEHVSREPLAFLPAPSQAGAQPTEEQPASPRYGSDRIGAVSIGAVLVIGGVILFLWLAQFRIGYPPAGGEVASFEDVRGTGGWPWNFNYLVVEPDVPPFRRAYVQGLQHLELDFLLRWRRTSNFDYPPGTKFYVYVWSTPNELTFDLSTGVVLVPLPSRPAHAVTFVRPQTCEGSL